MARKPSGRLLAFYIGTIAAVVALFGAVTAYGEKNLVAPPSIAGRYRLKTAALPPCLRDLDLQLQQSGAFLTATLPGQTPEAKLPQLTGRLQETNHFVLKLDRLTCKHGEPLENLAFHGKLVSAKQLTGVIKYRSTAPLRRQPWDNQPFDAVQTR
ncbi:MAG: hypothetical protein HC860_01150 [Alkalinema sp. RU_4_3]|nr:hypothetical protein [Alkalinema sp. RU_4_3]